MQDQKLIPNLRLLDDVHLWFVACVSVVRCWGIVTAEACLRSAHVKSLLSREFLLGHWRSAIMNAEDDLEGVRPPSKTVQLMTSPGTCRKYEGHLAGHGAGIRLLL